MIAQKFNDYIESSAEILFEMKKKHFVDSIMNSANLIARSAIANKPILICGNGGSAADAMHIAGELTGRFLIERRAIKAVSLSADSSVITSLGNDYNFEHIFSRQVESLGEPGGILWAITTSGKSPNIIAAVKTAKQNGLNVIAMTGGAPSYIDALSSVVIKVPSRVTPLIQQAHQLVYHFICEYVEQAVAKPNDSSNQC